MAQCYVRTRNWERSHTKVGEVVRSYYCGQGQKQSSSASMTFPKARGFGSVMEFYLWDRRASLFSSSLLWSSRSKSVLSSLSLQRNKDRSALLNCLQCSSCWKLPFCSSQEVNSLGNVLQAALCFNRLLPWNVYKRFWRAKNGSYRKRRKI